MPSLQRNYPLRSLNTFGIEAYCDYYAEIASVEDFLELMQSDAYTHNERLIIGGGSNLLFTQNFSGLVIRNSILGKTIVAEDEERVTIKAAAGENWHAFVSWCIEQGFGGLENLSLIPGCVGASPMQNIGAYGVEIKDVFVELEAIDMRSGALRRFGNAECRFGYRESIFKREAKNRYLIVSVTFSLSKNPEPNISYGAIRAELQSAGISEPTIRDVSEAVIRIRQSKLPDPKETGNAGSFFKNPEVSAEKYEELRAGFQDIVAYPLDNGRYKLAAGWLIEQCGLKGYEKDGAAVHSRQALVLVNKGNATGKAVFELSRYVLEKVFDKFGVQLEREVNII